MSEITKNEAVKIIRILTGLGILDSVKVLEDKYTTWNIKEKELLEKIQEIFKILTIKE